MNQILGRLNQKIFVRCVVSVVLLLLLCLKLDFVLITETMSLVDVRFFLFSLVLFLFRNVLASLRWQCLLFEKGQHIGWVSLTRYYLIGNFTGFFLPGMIGSDFTRGYYLYKKGISKRESASSILMERLMGFAVLLSLALLTFFIDYSLIVEAGVSASIVISSFLFATSIYLILIGRVDITGWLTFGGQGDKVRSIIENLHVYLKHPRAFWLALMYTALYQIVGISCYYLLAISVGSEMSFSYFLMFVPVVWIVSMVPFSLNGLGIRESAFVYMFAAAGMNRDAAILISFMYLILLVLQSMFGSMFYFFGDHSINAAHKSEEVNRKWTQ